MKRVIPVCLFAFLLVGWLPAEEKGHPSEPGVAAPSPTGPANLDEEKSLFEQFHRGGIWMYPILLCSFIGVAFALERFVNTRRSRILPPRLLEKLNGKIDPSRLEEIRHECRVNDSCLARILMAGIQRAGLPLAEMERTADEQSSRELYELRKNIRPLGIVASVAPMLGLLGTVSGMIQAFDVVARHGALGDPRLLSGSISVALLTTGFGLLVAIPALILHHYFRGRAENLIVEISDITSRALAQLEDRSAATAGVKED